MRNVNNTVETVNAAASAIVSAESRVQPSSVQKKKWGGWWSLYWCFGSQKSNKRIGHAVLVPEPVMSGSAPVVQVQTSSSSNSTSIFLPFIAPPSSPSSFLQSGPSSVSHTPHNTGLTVNAYSRNEPASAFAIGPYANETQPVTPPVDSAVYTPPPESSGQVSSCATPSSPEVPFAQLLTSSLERARRNGCGGGGVSRKFSAGHYEFKSHQVYPGSPGGGNLISPGSVVSHSGTSSPYPPGKCSIIEFRIGEPPKFLGFEHFTARKWGSRFGSGSITPAGGQSSRLGSGALTPDGGGSGGGLGSKLASGAVTPNGAEMVGSLLDSQIFEVASLANSDDDVSSRNDEGGAVAHRVSFELTGEDVARCFASKLYGVGLDEKANKWGDSVSGDELSEKLRTFSLGSSKEFKFDNTKEEMIEKTAEWWANEKVAGNGDNSPGKSWSFFPVLRSGGFS